MTRHVSRTHRVAMNWMFSRINVHPQIQIKSVDQKPKDLFDLCKPGRKMPKCIREGHPIRKSKNLRDLRLEVDKFRRASRFSSVLLPERVPIPFEVGARAMKRTKIRRGELHG